MLGAVLILGGGAALLGGLAWLGSRIPPRNLGRDEVLWLGAERALFPFGRQPTEPVDAESIRRGRPF